MNISIDESGTFVYTDAQDSWNCVAAYIYPEKDRRNLAKLIGQLKKRVGVNKSKEVKLNHLTQDEYLHFLDTLNNLDGVLYAIGTDASINVPREIKKHQSQQVSKILEHIEVMHYESGRQAVRRLADKVSRLPPQLYIQMMIQVQLVLSILRYAVLFFVQRHPPTLGKFRWRIDQKNSTKTAYEEAYTQILPALLQSASMREPMLMLEGANYLWFERFYYPEGEEPTYLEDVYGIQVGKENGRKLNVGKLVGEDVDFPDSESNIGIQVADLLASGLRRCLRNNFRQNDYVAKGLGSLMVQNEKPDAPLQLVGFGLMEGQKVSPHVNRTVRLMQRHARSMLLK